MTEQQNTPTEPRNGIHPETFHKDPAIQSLSDALRVSFRLLTFLMVLFVILFLCTGLANIDEKQRGVCKLFGKVVRSNVGPGLVFNWPYPFGEIQVVSTSEQRMAVDHFWMKETTRDKLKSLAERNRQNNGLNPGHDGYLFTGDRNIIHVRMNCLYRVVDVLSYVSQVEDPKAMLDMAIRQATIEVAGSNTADWILRSQERFRDEIKTRAQHKLDTFMNVTPEKGSAIEITSILIPSEGKTWPLAAYTAYEQAYAAGRQKDERIDRAKGKARNLAGVLGEKAFVQLVGEQWLTPREIRQKTEASRESILAPLLAGTITRYRSTEKKVVKYNLITQYTEAVDSQLSGQQVMAKELRKMISEVLAQSTTGGKVAEIISNAEADRQRIIANAKKRAHRVEQLHAQYKKSPQVFLEKLWANRLDEVLDIPTVTKWMLSPSRRQPTVIEINRDPLILKEIRNWLRKQQQGETDESDMSQTPEMP